MVHRGIGRANQPLKEWAMATKYDPLRLHLKRATTSSIVLTFAEIERVIGAGLPPTAAKRSEWWANETSPASRHVQCQAWRDAGFNAFPNLGARIVTFRRVGSS
jgi:hypothetical protein